jgi:YidC/Oxa1 family membrane protein insertase
MDDQNKNLLLATALSFAVILVWFLLFPPPEPAVQDPNASAVAQNSAASGVPAVPGVAGEAPLVETAAATPRIEIANSRVAGSISLVGGRIDELSLLGYGVSAERDSERVGLLRPIGGNNAYYALFGWAPGGALDFADVPGANTEWRVVGNERLTVDTPVTLEWSNDKGLVFQRKISLDERYMFTVTQTLRNDGPDPARVAPYGLIARHGTPPDLENFFISHEGVIQIADGKLSEDDYSDIMDYAVSETERAPMKVTEVASGGWIGFGDKYWMTALIPAAGTPFRAVQKYFPNRDVFQTETRFDAITVEPGQSYDITHRLFAGAKEWETLRAYQNNAAVPKFVDAIDWGWFFYLTKPIFMLLHWLNLQIGNMGWAILALTLILKAMVLPLAYKSYVSMARMKELQPEMEGIKERAGDDRQKLQMEMMKLYKEKKVNPAAGCLPILIQIPIFFSLYKVIFVTIELRHAPFFGVFNDLSAPDPTSIFNAFGFLPWAAPTPGSLLALIFIGLLPVLLGVTMWLQMKLNPAPTDPVQKQIFGWMPWVFMFILGGFASGLVIYWIANNVITFVQQYAIMRSHGHKPDLFGNMGLKKKPAK